MAKTSVKFSKEEIQERIKRTLKLREEKKEKVLAEKKRKQEIVDNAKKNGVQFKTFFLPHRKKQSKYKHRASITIAYRINNDYPNPTRINMQFTYGSPVEPYCKLEGEYRAVEKFNRDFLTIQTFIDISNKAVESICAIIGLSSVSHISWLRGVMTRFDVFFRKRRRKMKKGRKPDYFDDIDDLFD